MLHNQASFEVLQTKRTGNGRNAQNSVYVNDLITGDDDDKVAIYRKSKVTMSEGGLSLRKENFNSASLIEEIVKLEVPNNQLQQGSKHAIFQMLQKNMTSLTPNEDLSTSLSSPTSSDRKTVKVLGVNVENNTSNTV